MILEDVSDRPLYEVTLHVDPWLVQSAVRMHVDAKILRHSPEKLYSTHVKCMC